MRHGDAWIEADRLPEGRLRLRVPPCFKQRLATGEVRHRGARFGAGRIRGYCEIFPRSLCISVLGSVYALKPAEGGLVERDGLAEPPGALVGAREVDPRDQSVSVVGAQDPLAIGEGGFVERDGLD